MPKISVYKATFLEHFFKLSKLCRDTKFLISSKVAYNEHDKFITLLLKDWTSKCQDFDAGRCKNIAFLLIKVFSIKISAV